jgi:hypothetical protein
VFTDDDAEAEDMTYPLKFHLVKEVVEFPHGLKWSRARIMQVSFPREYLEDVLMATEGDEVALSMQSSWPMFMDIPDEQFKSSEEAQDTDEVLKLQAEALEAKKAGKVN